MKRSTALHNFFYDEYTKWRGDTCEACGHTHRYDDEGYMLTRALLTIHHLNGDVRNNEPENLITLCRPCHDKVEDGSLKLPTL